MYMVFSRLLYCFDFAEVPVYSLTNQDLTLRAILLILRRFPHSQKAKPPSESRLPPEAPNMPNSSVENARKSLMNLRRLILDKIGIWKQLCKLWSLGSTYVCWVDEQVWSYLKDVKVNTLSCFVHTLESSSCSVHILEPSNPVRMPEASCSVRMLETWDTPFGRGDIQFLPCLPSDLIWSRSTFVQSFSPPPFVLHFRVGWISHGNIVLVLVLQSPLPIHLDIETQVVPPNGIAVPRELVDAQAMATEQVAEDTPEREVGLLEDIRLLLWGSEIWELGIRSQKRDKYKFLRWESCRFCKGFSGIVTASYHILLFCRSDPKMTSRLKFLVDHQWLARPRTFQSHSECSRT